MLRHQLAQIANDASLQVPFGIVELSAADVQSRDLALDRLPIVSGVHPDVIIDVNRTISLMKLNEWARLVFFYLSRIPFQLPPELENAADHQAWQEVIAQAQQDYPQHKIASTVLFDGLPDPAIARPRLLSQAAQRAIQSVMAEDIRPRRTLPTFVYERLNQSPNPPSPATAIESSEDENTVKIFVAISPQPVETWNAVQRLRNQLSFVPEFFNDLRPVDHEMVSGVTYLQVDQAGSKSACYARCVTDDQGRVMGNDVLHIKTSIAWQSLIYGDNLGRAILQSYDLSATLPPPGPKRRWPGPPPVHPVNWLTRPIDSEMPLFPGEPSSTQPYGHSVDKLVLDRWLFWTWQCGRWTWLEICTHANNIGPIARWKRDAGIRPDQSKTAKKRAGEYGTWVGIALRPG